jgi:High potential iron-sulfur protein
MTGKLSRRAILLRSLQLSVAAGSAVALAACGKKEEGGLVCANFNDMSDGDRSARLGAHYTEKSTQPGQSCGACAFFHGEGAGCGNCDIFHGPANSAGRCDSWSART